MHWFGWVKNWPEILKKSWSMWIAFAGLVLPDLVSLVLTHLDDLTLSPNVKNYTRLVCLGLVIVLRPMHQVKVQPGQDVVEVVKQVPAAATVTKEGTTP